MKHGQRTGQWQADTGACRCPFFLIDLIKRLEYLLGEFGRYPVSVAGDADTEGGLFTPQLDMNGIGRIFECIVQQVAQYLGNGFAVDSSCDFFFGNIDR